MPAELEHQPRVPVQIAEDGEVSYHALLLSSLPFHGTLHWTGLDLPLPYSRYPKFV
jgi:hypothetical protein